MISNTSKKVAQRFMRKAIAEGPAAPEAEIAPIPSNRFVDLAVLVLAYQAYMDYLTGLGKERSPNSARGLVMIKRYSDEIVSGMNQIFTPLAERNDSGSIRTMIHRALQMTTPTPPALERWAEAIKVAMPWLKVRSSLFNSLFTGRSTRAARELAIIAEEVNPASALNKLAGIAPVSGLTATRKWIEILAAEAGAPLSSTESVMADAQVAKALGEDLNHLDASLAAAQPNTPSAAELQGKRVDLISQLDQVATTSNNPAVVLAVAAQAKPSDSHATEIGKKLGHTPDQEDAMMVRGRAVIAAGAGSGKTRVLASKVAYHINELGVPASAILATSFTKKASAELIERCGKYGATIQRSDDGFGTTHSIAGRAILDKLAPGYKRANYIGASEGWKQTTLFRLAIEQVKMGPLGIKPPEPKGLWDGLVKPSSGIAPAPVTPQDQGDTPSGSYSEDPAAIAEFVGVLRNVLGYLRWASNTWGGPRGYDARKWLDFMQDIYDFGVNPSKMTPDQKAKFNEIVGKLTAKGQPVTTYRVAARGGYHEPGISTSPEAPGVINLFEPDDPVDGGKPDPSVPMPRGKTHKMEERVYFKNPARQWFNLGLELMREDAKGNKTPIPMGEFRQVVSILKGKGISASEAWVKGVEGYLEPEADSVAVYGAYEWLKGSNGEPEFQNTGDMDDLLIDAVAALRGSSTVRQQIQSRFKVLLVDEAQDLNRTQHMMFGLMSGYLDPETLKPWPDGHMTADTFALIGDDKQAIYEFRGADPEEFISKSNMVENGGDFQTKLLDMNFRSGEAIVQAANNLIAKNKRQVPMVCKANTEKNGQGRIASRRFKDVEGAAGFVAEEIQGLVESSASGVTSYKNFGLALRSNAEAYMYGVEMLKKGIPFKSNARFFNDANTKALIGWLTLADKGLNGPPDDVEEAIRDCTKAPFSLLGAAFFTRLEEKAKGPWAQWLVEDENWRRIYASGGKAARYYDALEHFVANLVAVSKMTGTPSEIIVQILELRGADGVTTKQAMINNILEDDDVMAELAAASEGGAVTEDQISDQALAPINPLLSLVKGRDEIGPAMVYIKKLKNVNAKVTSADTDKELDRDAVTIGTMHSWKGLEVPTMYIPMIGGKFPRAGKEGVAPETPALASERRLAYVAITRAEQRAVILDIPSDAGHSSQFLKEACIQSERSQNEGTAAPKMATRWDGERLASMG